MKTEQNHPGILFLLGVLCVLCGEPVTLNAGEAPTEMELLAKIGQWDGVTQSAELEGPYEDWKQQEVPFGRISYYLAPWRSYMDTWPASQFLNCLGINFNIRDDRFAEPVAQVLSEVGMRSARVEFGWGSLSYDDPPRIPENTAKSWSTRLKALMKSRIRPLILLNANSGWPCPIKSSRAKLMKPAEKGAREIFLDGIETVSPGFTGLRGQAYQVAFPLIVKADKETGRCELSAPLAKDLREGPLDLLTLKYKPFAGKTFADGSPNPDAQATVDGWMNYVSVICKFAKETLGVTDFYLEVWNEYTFGSQFLDEKYYYNPERKFKDPLTYSNHGKTIKGHELILPMTVDYVNDPAHALAGVKVISGFSNQRPWEHGGEMWPGQAGFSRHYYTGINTARVISPATPLKPNSGPINALGKPDGKPEGKEWHTVVPGSYFVPTHIVNMPEWWHYSYQTEFMTRNIQPFPGPWGGARFSHPDKCPPAEVWMTEANYDRQQWAEKLMKETGCAKTDPRLVALLHHIGAKATLRLFIFYSHKGVHTINLFAAQESDAGLGFLPEAFFKALKAANYQLTPEVKAQVGPQAEALRFATHLLGFIPRLESSRPLSVEKLVEHQPRLVFKGDGTPEHPDRYHRDDFACLPFQSKDNWFAVGYYVMTRDMVHTWKKDAGPLDPARYDMPEQQFDLTLSNFCGEGAGALAWDPITGRQIAVEVLSRAQNSITVRLQTVDYPRFLVIYEKRNGPLIEFTKLKHGDQGLEVVFESSGGPKAVVSWGPIRQRNNKSPMPLAGSSRGEGLADHQKTLQIEEGKGNCVSLPALGENDGVKILLEANGLFARWPFWDDDVLGRGGN